MSKLLPWNLGILNTRGNVCYLYNCLVSRGQVRWLHNDEAVSGPRYEMLSSDASTHALRIHRVVAEDAGTLTAVATNSLGTASHSAKLSVVSDPSSMAAGPHDQHVEPVNGMVEPPPASLRHGRGPRSFDSEQAAPPLALSRMTPGM